MAALIESVTRGAFRGPVGCTLRAEKCGGMHRYFIARSERLGSLGVLQGMTFHERADQGSKQSLGRNSSCGFTTIISATTDALTESCKALAIIIVVVKAQDRWLIAALAGALVKRCC